MTTLDTWAARHNIPSVAVQELRALLIGLDATPHDPSARSEAAIQNEIRMETSRRGGRLWRNNNGAGKLENGSYVRWGLCNDSPTLNAHVKSADLIGVLPVTVTPEMVGTVIGQFWSVECKRDGWKYAGTDREKAQLRWIEMITSLGGKAQFSTGELS